MASHHCGASSSLVPDPLTCAAACSSASCAAEVHASRPFHSITPVTREEKLNAATHKNNSKTTHEAKSQRMTRRTTSGSRNSVHLSQMLALHVLRDCADWLALR